MKLGNAGWAGNILATLYGKNLIGRKESLESGRPV